MAFFVKLNKDNMVLDCIAISDEIIGEPENIFPDTEKLGLSFIKHTLKLDGDWKQTSYNGNFRGTYAGIGYTYDSDLDVFVAPPMPTTP